MYCLHIVWFKCYLHALCTWSTKAAVGEQENEFQKHFERQKTHIYNRFSITEVTVAMRKYAYMQQSREVKVNDLAPWLSRADIT